MNLQIRYTAFEKLGGVKIPLLICDDELELISAGYLMSRFNSGAKIATLEIAAKGIKMLYEFCAESSIDIHNRLSRLDILNVGEIERLSAYISANQETGEVRAAGTYRLRYLHASNFISWLWNFYQNRAANDPERLNHSKNKKQVMDHSFKIHTSAPYKTTGRTLIGLTPELRAKFFEIINPLPENALNPFKSERVKWRNFILLLTMILGGNRRSESLLLQMNHLCLLGRDKYFEIVRDDSPLPAAYTHKKAPSVKTKGRKVALSNDIANLILHYVNNIRPQFESYKKVSHLFLSTRGKGKPLSVDSPNKITDKIIEAFPEYEGLLSPHRLRNTFHDLLNDSLDETIDPNLGPIMKGSYKSVLQEYAGGWARGSQMAAKYPAGSIERRVAEMTVSLQKNILSGGNNNNKESNDDK
ncbi:MAG: hypothetical protein ACXV8J_05120 [Methylobacter sp.]